MNVEPLNRYNVTTEVEGAISPSLVLVLVLVLALNANAQDTELPTSGYGPPTALPPEVSITKPAARPPWVMRVAGGGIVVLPDAVTTGRGAIRPQRTTTARA